jgi:gentisate 1,2-dioxygenase
VIQGSGSTRAGSESVAWRAGDAFITPGGSELQHTANARDAVLWLVTNEPHVAFECLNVPKADHAPTGVVHYPADEIARQVALIQEIGGADDIAGAALVFSSDLQEASRNALPSLTFAMNTLAPGTMQRPHRHNSVAVSLVIQGNRCYSMIDGERKDWIPWATTVTPPTSVHSHHNEGDALALFLIVQDGGLYYHARAMGFEFVDT